MTSPMTTTEQITYRSTNKYFVLAVLGFVNLFNYMDRNLFAVLVEHIKADMQFSDTQMGLLGGFSFALCYAIFGLLAGRLADRTHRVKLLTLALSVWSLASAACGLARNFFEMVLARVGVGIGESGCIPTAHSLIGDYFPPTQRALAVSIFTGVGSIGTILGLVLGAALADLYDWRTVFIAFGLPGLLLAALLIFLIREPVRGRYEKSEAQHTPNFLQSAKTLLGKRTVKFLLLAIPLYYFMMSGAGMWIPSFYVRVHDIPVSEFGRTGGVALGLGGLLGTFLGGFIANHLIARHRIWEFWLPAMTAALSIPLFAFALYVNELNLSYTFLLAAAIVTGCGIGTSMSTMHSVSEVHVRAVAIGFMLLATSLIAYGFGPLFVGLMSDWLLAWGWVDNSALALRWALLLALITPMMSCVLFLLAGQSATTDVVN